MDNFGERLSILITTIKMKRSEFAETLGVSAPFVTQMCAGTKMPSNRTIEDICTKFGVNEQWLRTGTGDMFRELTKEEEIANFIGEVVNDAEDSVRRSIISGLAKLNAKDWEVIAEIIRKFREG